MDEHSNIEIKKKVWLKLADVCDQAVGDDRNFWLPPPYNCCGLCMALMLLRIRQEISAEICESMLAKIDELPDHPANRGWKWLRGQAGMAARAAWCRKQAELIAGGQDG